MAVASGTCPSCGAPIEFGVGSSIAKVCEYCQATVCRSDRGLENLGKVAEIANVPSLIAVGDSGTLSGRAFTVMGRVQLDHGAGPWDEYYVTFDHGATWGWIAYAEGQWLVTSLAPGHAVPAYGSLAPEQDITLGELGSFRVSEVRQATIVSAEGELPAAVPPGAVRYYADCFGINNAYATLDYGDMEGGGYEVFAGSVIAETELQVTQAGPRSTERIKTKHIQCPNCGGEVPKLNGDRATRLGCPYCGAVSDITLQQVVAQQEKLMTTPDIPIGATGSFDGVNYICIAYMRRGSDYDGDHFSWEEYLLCSAGIGYRWLVKDEKSWVWSLPVNLAEVDMQGLPQHAGWSGKKYPIRNRSDATIEYVLGELYWKAAIGDRSQVLDFQKGVETLSREAGGGEVRWSYSANVPWAVVAEGFQLDVDGPGGEFIQAAGTGWNEGEDGELVSQVVVLIIILVLLLVCCNSCGGCGYRSSGVYFGGGYYGGK